MPQLFRPIDNNHCTYQSAGEGESELGSMRSFSSERLACFSSPSFSLDGNWIIDIFVGILVMSCFTSVTSGDCRYNAGTHANINSTIMYEGRDTIRKEATGNQAISW